MKELDALARVIEEVVAPNAADVDTNGTFPRAAIDALGAGGLLGLLSATEVGGAGQGLDAAAQVVEQLAEVCGSTAMVVMMHYSAAALIEQHGPREVREAIAAGRHLTTLAFSETGSRSHFWSPVSTATRAGETVTLDARKSWVTAAGQANSYVWSSRPVEAEGPMTLWFVSADAAGLEVAGPFDGLGLRGNASRPVTASSVKVAADAMLGPNGEGLNVALQIVLPVFLVLNAAASLGTMRAVVTETIGHLTGTTFEQRGGEALAQQVLPRVELARMQIQTDGVATLIGDTLTAMGEGRDDATLRVLEVKAAAGEAAIDVTDLAMRVCGGSAFRKELGVERRFRDARAARVMAPTTEALLDFVGRALTGIPLIDEVNA